MSRKALFCSRYDPWRDVWYKVRPMQVARRSPGVVAYRGKLYVVGGMGETADLKSTEVYDPMINHWAKLPFSMKDICGEVYYAYTLTHI